MKRYVIVELAGGLGNQIFLFEIALLVSSIGNRKVLINKTYIDKNHSSGNSTLEDFILPSNVRIFELRPIFRKFYRKMLLFLGVFNRFNQSPILVLSEDLNMGSREAVNKIILSRDPFFTIIVDYWQNFSYWQDDFIFELKYRSKEFEELLLQMKTDDPIVFHYRLGKINNKWEHAYGALSPVYLMNCLKNINMDSVKTRKIWVFSNDLNEAQKLIIESNLNFYDIKYVDDVNLSPAEVMMLLSKAKVLICSNSTFSISAAKIGKIPKVLVPSELSKKGHNVIPLPYEWIKIDSVWLE